jgi:hypothetical protein
MKCEAQKKTQAKILHDHAVQQLTGDIFSHKTNKINHAHLCTWYYNYNIISFLAFSERQSV